MWRATETLGGPITTSPGQGPQGQTPTTQPRHAADPEGPGLPNDNGPPRQCSLPLGDHTILGISGHQWRTPATKPLLRDGRPIEGGILGCHLAPQPATVQDVHNRPGMANRGLFAARHVATTFSHRITPILGGPPGRRHAPRSASAGDVHDLPMMDDQGLIVAGRVATPLSHLTTLTPTIRFASSRDVRRPRGMEPLASTAPAPVNGGADTYGGANNRTNTRRSKLLVRSPSATAHPGTASTENFAPSLAWTDPGPVHEGSNTPSTARSVLPSGWHRVTGRRARNNPRRPLVRTALLGTPNCPCSQHRDSRKASLG